MYTEMLGAITILRAMLQQFVHYTTSKTSIDCITEYITQQSGPYHNQQIAKGCQRFVRHNPLLKNVQMYRSILGVGRYGAELRRGVAGVARVGGVDGAARAGGGGEGGVVVGARAARAHALHLVLAR